MEFMFVFLQYVMIVLKGSIPILLGGTEEPAAHGELASIGGLSPDNCSVHFSSYCILSVCLFRPRICIILCPYPQSFCVLLVATVSDSDICRDPTSGGIVPPSFYTVSELIKIEKDNRILEDGKNDTTPGENGCDIVGQDDGTSPRNDDFDARAAPGNVGFNSPRRRIKRSPSWMDDYVHEAILSDESICLMLNDDPKCFDEAIKQRKFVT
ncbi:hypothetical protein SADUNF_Sadunf16G0107600 [Salix dunnii]|uniref:Uncharacterized protein n=1 Tax=Salix dunnii TaxID=1413687 RepID=A0A835J842_9ROSI|nr:hypothetical protein SADUNF_Sadunf16G0107600 [Salix dunnii]